MNDPSILGGFLFILGLIQWLLKSLLHASTDRYLDGSRPLSIFGNIFILKRLQSSPDRELVRIARNWGDTCLLWAAQYPMLIVNKPKVAKELLVDVRLIAYYMSCILIQHREVCYILHGRSPTISGAVFGHGDCPSSLAARNFVTYANFIPTFSVLNEQYRCESIKILNRLSWSPTS